MLDGHESRARGADRSGTDGFVTRRSLNISRRVRAVDRNADGIELSGMRGHRMGALLALGLALVASAPAHAQPDPDATEPIRVLEMALSQPGDDPPASDTVRSVIERAFDTAAIATAVLADHGAAATPGQLEHFRAALVGHIAREILDRRGDAPGASLVLAGTRRVRDGEWLVTSRIGAAERQRTIVWRVRSAPGGAAIHDVTDNGTSMVRMLRNEYAPALRRLGIEAVTAEMEARNLRARE